MDSEVSDSERPIDSCFRDDDDCYDGDDDDRMK